MPALNYSTPLHNFASGGVTYTATKDCYVCGALNSSTLYIDNTVIAVAVNSTIKTSQYSTSIENVFVSPLLVKAGSVITVSAACEIKVFEEA